MMTKEEAKGTSLSEPLLPVIGEDEIEENDECPRSYTQTRLGNLGRTFSTRNLFGYLDEWAKGVEIHDAHIHRKLSSEREKQLRKTESRKLTFIDANAQKDLDELLEDFKVTLDKGLTTDQATLLREKHGENQLESDPPTPIWRLFLDQFNDILVILLIIACIISMALGQYAAGTTIVIIVMFNAILGAVQEHGAGAALDALKALQVTHAKVIRNGIEDEIEGTKVVPGDVVILGTGDSAVADIRVVEAQDLESNEASLTGESEPVKKVSTNIVQSAIGLEDTEKLTLGNVIYMGTEVTNGKGKGIVIHTGMNTKIGHLAERLKSVDSGQSPLKAKLALLGVRLGMASVFISLVIFVIGVSTGRGADNTSSDPIWLQMLLVAVSLTVAAVPEGLPVCVTMSLAIGMRHMTKKKALVRKLASVETLGSTSIICTDKTGTLTCGKMTTVKLWRFGQCYKVTGQGYDPEGIIYPIDESSESMHKDPAAAFEKVKAENQLQPILAAFLLCSDATVELEDVVVKNENGEEKTKKEWVGQGNMTERALVVAARKLGIERKDLKESFTAREQNPFSSKRKMMSVIVECKDQKESIFSSMCGSDRVVAITKGAPNRVIDRCTHMMADGKVVTMDEKAKANALDQVNKLSAQALRVLAVGVRSFEKLPEDTGCDEVECKLVFMGLNAAIDPERPEVIDAISRAANAGVTTVMITGDYLATARAIAENIGLLEKGKDNSNRVMDCKRLRQLGADITKITKQLDQGSVPKEEKRRLESELTKLHKQVDSMTSRTKVYARAEPFDKITIVESYQRQGHVACMTGDGVNDAAALQGANIGVAMGSGTDVAKGAADMVLLDDSFATIVAAIEEGRKIYANITKFVFYLLSTNVAEVFVILIAMLAGLQSPLAPIQILWLNLCTDGAPAIALALEHAEPGIMDEGPRPISEPVLEKIQITGITIQTIVQTALCLYTYIQGLLWNTGSWDGQNPNNSDSENTEGIRKAQTMVIYLIVFLELMRAYTSRALRTSIVTMGVFSNSNMQYAVCFSVVFTLLVGNIPGLQGAFSMRYLSLREWALVIAFTPVCALLDEFTKSIYRATGFGERPKIGNKKNAEMQNIEHDSKMYVALDVGEENQKELDDDVVSAPSNNRA